MHSSMSFLFGNNIGVDQMQPVIFHLNLYLCFPLPSVTSLRLCHLPSRPSGGAFFEWFLFVGKLAAPLLWKGAVSLLTEGRGAARGLFKMLNKKVVVSFACCDI